MSIACAIWTDGFLVRMLLSRPQVAVDRFMMHLKLPYESVLEARTNLGSAPHVRFTPLRLWRNSTLAFLYGGLRLQEAAAPLKQAHTLRRLPAQTRQSSLLQ